MSIDTLINQNPGLITFLLIWVLFWKGLALWKAAQEKEKWWFFFILVINTLGILPIIYLLVVKKYFENKK